MSRIAPDGVSPREERRRVRLETARTQVLDASEPAFAVSGFHNTTIKSIAEQCEIAVGTIYLLFADKEGLSEAVLRRRGGALRELTAELGSEPGSGDVRLVAIAEMQIRYFREHPDWTRLASTLVSGNRAAPPNRGLERLYEVGHKVVADVLAEVVAAGQREGTIRGGNPQALALIYLGMLETFHSIDNESYSEPGTYGAAEFLELLRDTFRAR